MGALRVVRWSAHYDQTVSFYRDIVGLPVLETFRDSYGLDGTILALPGGPVHLEIVRLTDARQPPPGPFDISAARPPEASARRHRFADIRVTRNRCATSRSLAPASINSAAANRTCSRRARSAAVSPPPSGYLMILA